MAVNLLATRSWVNDQITYKNLVAINSTNELVNGIYNIRPEKINWLISNNSVSTYITLISKNGENILRIEFEPLELDRYEYVKIRLNTPPFKYLPDNNDPNYGKTVKIFNNQAFILNENTNRYSKMDIDFDDTEECVQWIEENSGGLNIKNSTIFYQIKYKLKINFFNSNLLDESLKNKYFEEIIEEELQTVVTNKNDLINNYPNYNSEFDKNLILDKFNLNLKINVEELLEYEDYNLSGSIYIDTAYLSGDPLQNYGRFKNEVRLNLPNVTGQSATQFYIFIKNEFDGVTIQNNDIIIKGDYCKSGSDGNCLIKFTLINYNTGKVAFAETIKDQINDSLNIE